MKQKVHSVSYLAKAEFKFNNGVYDLVALPSGAEVVKVSLEVVGGGDAVPGVVSVGFREDINTSAYFLDNIVVATQKHIASDKDYTATGNKVVVAGVKNANDNHVKGVLRVLYFLPSVIEVEY